MTRFWWMLITFSIMYLVGTVLGFGSYLLLSPTAMWVVVFTFMPVFCALLIWWYLKAIKSSGQKSAWATMEIVAVWIVLSFASDAVAYIWIVPRLRHGEPNWLFFVDQSPWIWLSYAVLALSGYAGHRFHVSREEAQHD